MKKFSTDEELLFFLEDGNKLKQMQLIHVLEAVGFIKVETLSKVALKHNDVDEDVEFYKRNYMNNSQKQIGQVIRIIREVIAKRHGDNHFEIERENDKLLQQMGIQPPNRKTILESISTTTISSEEEAIRAVLEKRKNPNKGGKRKELLRGKILKKSDFKSDKSKHD